MPPSLTSVPKENQRLKNWLKSDKALQLRLLDLIFFFLQKPTMVFGSGGDTREVMDESDHWEQGP